MEKELAYLLGAFRDGSIHSYKDGKDCEFIILQKEKWWLTDVVAPKLETLLNRKFSVSEKMVGGVYRIRFRSKQLFSLLVEKYNFPYSGKQVFWNPAINNEYITDYLRGFFDAEGGVFIKGKNIRVDFYQSWHEENSCPPLEEIRRMLLSLGIKCGSVRKRKSNGMQNFPRYVLSISNKRSVIEFAKIVGSNHPRKREYFDRLLSVGISLEAAII